MMNSIPLVDILEKLKRAPARRFVLRANGRSMVPTIVRGDRIHLSAPERPLRTGDIILCRDRSGRCMIHRVIATEPELRTKGDACEERDGEIDQVYGIVDSIEPTWVSRLRRCWITFKKKGSK